MYAIVDIAGQQFKVEKDQKLFVHRLGAKEGEEVSFNRVLLIDTGSKVSVGDPVVKGASVTARIVSHVKGDKVLVFKKKRRKGYKKLNGHRQYLTQIEITSISEKSSTAAKPKTAASESDKPKADSKKSDTPTSDIPTEKEEAEAKKVKKETEPKPDKKETKARAPKKEPEPKPEKKETKAKAPKKEPEPKSEKKEAEAEAVKKESDKKETE